MLRRGQHRAPLRRARPATSPATAGTRPYPLPPNPFLGETRWNAPVSLHLFVNLQNRQVVPDLFRSRERNTYPRKRRRPGSSETGRRRARDPRTERRFVLWNPRSADRRLAPAWAGSAGGELNPPAHRRLPPSLPVQRGRPTSRYCSSRVSLIFAIAPIWI